MWADTDPAGIVWFGVFFRYFENAEEELFRALPITLGRAVEAILADPNYDESKQNRTFMKVHAKGGQSCPRCGHRISQLGSNREPLNFCRGCQF